MKQVKKNSFFITKDIIGEGEPTYSITNLPKGGHVFRLYDGDDVLYLEGVFYGDKDSEAGFIPQDWGMGEYGITRIDYCCAGRWETL